MNTQKEFFNTAAYSWDELCRHDMKKVEGILDLLEIKKGSRVLDVGAGTGVLVPSLSRRVTDSGHITAVDIAEKMIEVAERKHKYENVIFSCEDALVKSENELPYDHILCYSMFPHFNNKKEVIEKLRAKLKVGGKLTIFHSQTREAINQLHQGKGEAVKHDNLPTKTEFMQLFSDAQMEPLITIDDHEKFVMIAVRAY